MGHSQGGPRRIVGRQPTAGTEWTRGRRCGSWDAVEPVVPDGSYERASPRPRRSGPLQHECDTVEPSPDMVLSMPGQYTASSGIPGDSSLTARHEV